MEGTQAAEKAHSMVPQPSGPTLASVSPYLCREMARFMLHTVRLLVLVAFMAGSSGWVLHRHWCPEGLEQRLSFIGPSDCGMLDAPLTKQAEQASCCQKPAEAAPKAAAHCTTQDNCCHDAQVLLAGLAPFVVQQPTAIPDAGMELMPVFARELARKLVQPMLVRSASLPPDRAGPPPPTAERLSLAQVYRI